jgi:glycosyltransferase involved in cell wall biosynthesis
MRTLIIGNIVSSNLVYRFNTYINKNKKSLGEILVLFCGETESNRRWKLHEKITFRYKILQNRKIEVGGSDLFTYFLNFSAWHEFEDFDPDRIIITGWSQFSCQLAYTWALIHHKKIILWSGSTVNEKSWRRIVTLPLVWLMVRMSDKIIAYGKRSKEYLMKLGATSRKTSILMNDVNGTYFRNESSKWRENRELTKKKFKIRTKFNFIYVGQLIKRKGVLDLVRAFEIFRLRNPDWGLVIVGYGKEESLIKNYVKNNKVEKVYFLGNIEQYSLPRIYVACDCLILPSKEEVWGLVVNEALYCGLKVIVSERCGCVPDLVSSGQNGYFFNPFKTEDLLIKMNETSYLIEKTLINKPFFSIITCTKNSAKYLRTNIKSIEEQTFKNYEHIFVDGFSEDGTIQLIKKYRAKHSSTVNLYQSKPQGISNAMNIGISKAKGKYILILHSDDGLYRNDVLKKVNSYLIERPELDWIYGKINVIEEDEKSIGQYPARWIYRFFPKYFLKFYNTIPHQAVFMDRSVFRRFGGFDETLSSVMDVDYWLKIRTNTNYLFFNEIISNFMIRKGAQSSGMINKLENYKNSLKVRKRYLSPFEIEIYKIIKLATSHFSKTYR